MRSNFDPVDQNNEETEAPAEACKINIKIQIYPLKCN